MKQNPRRLSPLGIRAQEVIATAALLPMDPPPSPGRDGEYHYEGDRWWIKESGRWKPCEPTEDEKQDWRVTEVAREYDTMEKLADALTAALKVGLTKHVESLSPMAKINLPANGYDVAIDFIKPPMNAMWNLINGPSDRAPSPERTFHSVRLFVADEILAEHTTSKVAFSNWITAVCAAVVSYADADTSKRQEAEGAHAKLLNLGLSVSRLEWLDTPESFQAQVEEAIASIARD